MATLTNEWVDLEMVSDSGTGNGTATDFVTSQNIKSTVGTTVAVDGLIRKITTDYTVDLNTNTIAFTVAPAVGQSVNIKYFKRGI